MSANSDDPGVRSFMAVLSAVFLAGAVVGAVTLVEMYQEYVQMPPNASGIDYLGFALFGPLAIALTLLVVPGVCGAFLAHRITNARLIVNRVAAGILWVLYALFVFRQLSVFLVAGRSILPHVLFSLVLAVVPVLYTVAVRRCSQSFARAGATPSSSEDESFLDDPW